MRTEAGGLLLANGTLPHLVTAQAWHDPAYRARLLAEPHQALAELGAELGMVYPAHHDLVILSDEVLLRHYTLPWIDPRLAARGPDALRRTLAREMADSNFFADWLPCPVLQKAATDGAFRVRLLSDPLRALLELNIVPPSQRLVVMANGPTRTYLPLRFRSANDPGTNVAESAAWLDRRWGAGAA